jgi:hypothetical protein
MIYHSTTLGIRSSTERKNSFPQKTFADFVNYFLFGTISELFRFQCDSRIREQNRKNAYKQQQAKDSQNRLKKFNCRHNRSGRKRKQALLGREKRDRRRDRSLSTPVT